MNRGDVVLGCVDGSVNITAGEGNVDVSINSLLTNNNSVENLPDSQLSVLNGDILLNLNPEVYCEFCWCSDYVVMFCVLCPDGGEFML